MNVARFATPSSSSTPSAELSLALDVGEHRERQLLEVLVVLAPREVHELAVDRGAEHLRVAIRELAVLAAELRDLGRADEREVLRPEEHHEPLARVALVRDGLERRVELLGHGRFERELGKLVTYRQHSYASRLRLIVQIWSHPRPRSMESIQWIVVIVTIYLVDDSGSIGEPARG